jgi:hypothetical protein
MADMLRADFYPQGLFAPRLSDTTARKSGSTAVHQALHHQLFLAGRRP